MSEKSELGAHISPFSKLCESNQQGKRLDCSSTAGWTSLLVQTFKNPAVIEPYETLPTPDQLIVLVTKGEFEVGSYSNRSWKKAIYRPGLGGMTAGGNTSRIRARSKESDGFESLHIYIPQFFFAAAADEFRRAGVPFRMNQPDALGFYDPVIAQTAYSLKEAFKLGAPNLYAESAAQFLAVHLLSIHSRWSEPYSGVRNPGALTDRRLRRVLEFMQHHYAEDLSIEQLSKEGGISRFHFIRLFKESFGVTPHQHLVRLRMGAAAKMLGNTDLSVQAIALKCGYLSTGHFSANFQKHFGQTPFIYRAKLSGVRLV
jgi:AraC family transcriptional regulator